MYIQKIWITLLVTVALCPLAQKHSCSLAIEYDSTLNPNLENSYLFVDEDVPSVVPLEPDHPEMRADMTIKSQKVTDSKTIEKKKPLRLNDSVKVKNETKFQKLKDPKLDEKISKILDVNRTGIDEAPVEGNPGNPTLLNTAISRAINDADTSEARASNVSALEPTNSLYANHSGDLSDVNMDEEDTNMEGGEYVASHNETQKMMQPMALPTTSTCIDGNKTYALGDTILRGCDEQCICGENSSIQNCKPLCNSPYVIAGRSKHDSYCGEQRIAENHCCAIVYCSEKSDMKAEDSCTFGNKTLSPGEQIHDECVRTCICQSGGTLKCQPRCPPNDTSSAMNHLDRCVALTDPRDPCCTITYCDVTLGEHEMKPVDDPDDLSVNIIDVKVLNSTAIKLKLSADLHNHTIIQVSKNNDDWTQDNPDNGGIISKLEPAHNYYVRVKEGNRTGAALRVIMPAEVIKTNVTEKIMCNHQGKQYEVGEKWYDECIALCICDEGGKSECLTLECPTDFGLDVLNPHCLDWETVPPNFVPKAPKCCPEQVRCRNNGSCVYENNVYDNWSEIPSNVTGCEKRCYCEIGKVSCQAACPPVPALPPSTLSCPASQAVLEHLPNDDCCSHWVCNAPDMQEHNFHTGFPMLTGIPGYNSQTPGQSSANEIIIKALDALDDRTVRLIFTVPPVFVGLHGRVELRYTSDKNNMDPSTWKSQLFIPPDDLIATPQLEFELDGLEPATEYKVRVTMNLRDIGNSPSSKIYKVTTLSRQEEQGVLPPQIPVDAELRVAETNSTWANIVWKKFTEYEMQFIDGVQLRYKEHDGKVYSTTPLIHRAVTNYVIENLKPACTYEVGISIIPFPGQTTELISEKTAQIMTALESDPYAFDVKVDIKMVKSQDVEITWTGVPYPEDKYVNIYRAIYQSDSGKGDTSTFKIAKRDSPAKTLISGLKPGTRYRLWLEMYLTNGRIKKSNVQDFITKPGVVLTSAGITQQGKLASLPLHEDDYYGPLVIVAIVASLAILSTLILLMMLMKRRSSSKADISPRKTTSAYDNPSYKVEIQQETMDL